MESAVLPRWLWALPTQGSVGHLFLLTPMKLCPSPSPFLTLFTFPVLAQILPPLWRWLHDPGLLCLPYLSASSSLHMKWAYYWKCPYRGAVIRTESECRCSMTSSVSGIGLWWVLGLILFPFSEPSWHSLWLWSSAAFYSQPLSSPFICNVTDIWATF